LGDELISLNLSDAGTKEFPIIAHEPFVLFTQHGLHEFEARVTAAGEDLAPAESVEFGHGHEHEHDETVRSIAFEFDRDLSIEKLNAWLGPVLAERGIDIFRMKGILAIAGEAQRFVFQGVHMLFDGRPDRAWAPGERRKSQLVFIGRNLDRVEFEEGLRSCLA
jgi:G3E family GTPase